MCRRGLVAMATFSLILVTKVSSHWLPPSAFSKGKSTSHDLFGDTPSDFLARNVRDIDHCGPDDPIPPNRVNTTEQVL